MTKTMSRSRLEALFLKRNATEETVEEMQNEMEEEMIEETVNEEMDEEVIKEEAVEEDFILEEHYDPPKQPKRPSYESKEAHEQAKHDYEQLFMEEFERGAIDPFGSWEQLHETLKEESRFQAIHSERERKDLFKKMAPLLSERARTKRIEQTKNAEQTWNGLLQTLQLEQVPGTWTEYSRSIRKHPWYKLLKPDAMEKQYRARLAELKARATVYKLFS